MQILNIEDTKVSVKSLTDYQKLLASKNSETDIPVLQRLKSCTAGIHTHISELINLYTGAIDANISKEDIKSLVHPTLGIVLLFILIGHDIYGIEAEGNPIDLWKDLSKPNMDTVAAKLSHNSSVIFSRVFAYGESALEAGLDHDLKQLLSFLSLYAEYYDIDLVEVMETYCSGMSLS